MPEETSKMLHQLHGELIEFRAETKTHAKQVQGLLEDHHTTLYGDGNGVPGLRMRTDRLEQHSKAREKHIWAIWTAILGSVFAAFVATVASWFQKP